MPDETELEVFIEVKTSPSLEEAAEYIYQICSRYDSTEKRYDQMEKLLDGMTDISNSRHTESRENYIAFDVTVSDRNLRHLKSMAGFHCL